MVTGVGVVVMKQLPLDTQQSTHLVTLVVIQGDCRGDGILCDSVSVVPRDSDSGISTGDGVVPDFLLVVGCGLEEKFMQAGEGLQALWVDGVRAFDS